MEHSQCPGFVLEVDGRIELVCDPSIRFRNRSLSLLSAAHRQGESVFTSLALYDSPSYRLLCLL
jgi:hypothetical protein